MKNRYVYALIDPRNRETFYIGKGVRRRCFQHERDVVNDRHPNANVSRRIRSILAAGLHVDVNFLAEGLSESDALRRERTEIAQRDALCNIAPGHGSPEDIRRDRMRELLRRAKPISRVLKEGRVNRTLYLGFLKAAAMEFANPTPTLWTRTEGGRWVGSF